MILPTGIDDVAHGLVGHFPDRSVQRGGALPRASRIDQHGSACRHDKTESRIVPQVQRRALRFFADESVYPDRDFDGLQRTRWPAMRQAQ